MGIFSTPRYQEIVVHDLRTPLNVITLALRMIDDSITEPSEELTDDLNLIRANAAELERMLGVLVDFSSLPETSSRLAIGQFNPQRMVHDLVESVSEHSTNGTITLETNGSPPAVQLDERLAQMAIHKALLNTLTASQGKPVRVEMDGAPDRLIIRLIAELPPRDSVTTHNVSPEAFERVIGSPGERRGLDLSIAARIGDLFGGTTRLESQTGRATVITLDWPARLNRSE